jgi:pimeloyl-ACP methyl ester carboxylesterase
VIAGEGDLILFAHGFPEFWYMWKDQIAEFAEDHQAVALDMRGYNLSSKPEGMENYQIDILTEDIRCLVEHTGHKKFTLVAHDWGGIVAWRFANKHPEYLDRLVIVNAPHPGVFARLFVDNPDQQAASQYMLLFRSPMAEEMLSADNCSALLSGIETEAARLSDEDKRRYIEAWTQPGALTGGLNYYRAMPFEPPPAGEAGSESVADFLASTPREMLEVIVPTLVIWGEQDTALTIHNLDGLKEYVPDLTIKRVPEGSHWVVREQPQLINDLIREYIRCQRRESRTRLAGGSPAP